MKGVAIFKRKFPRGHTRVGREMKSTGINGRRVNGRPLVTAVRERGRG